MTEFVADRQIYERIVLKEIPSARRFLWIGTADLKDLHVTCAKRFVPFLSVLAGLVEASCEVRLIHAKEPGMRFRRDFDRYPALLNSDRFERMLCPRVHFKCLIVDGRAAFISSANLTGAGMGGRSVDKRNFEAGILTDEPGLVSEIMDYYDAVFIGRHCQKCRLRKICPDPIA